MTTLPHGNKRSALPYRTRVTIADLAEHTGLSTATISRVLNGKSTVADDTRQIVLAALDELGYRRPAAAQPHTESLVGIIVPDLENPIYPLYLQSLETTLSRQGFRVLLLCEQSIAHSEDEIVTRLLDYDVQAAIFIGGKLSDVTYDKAPYQRLCNAGVRVVVINGDTHQLPAMSIAVDNVATMQSVVNHLTALGHQRIGLTTGSTRYIDTLRKKQAFLEAMQHKDLEATAMTISSLTSIESGQAMALSLIDQECTALICANALLALGALLAARSRDLLIPQNLSIVGFDDFVDAPYLTPSLTTVRQPIIPMSEAAIAAITDDASPTPFNPSELVFQGSLIVRESTGPHRL